MIRCAFLSSLIFLFFMPKVMAQDDWIEYVSIKDKGVMSTSLDLSLDIGKPNYKNLLIVGGKFKKCLKNGFPSEESLSDLYAFSDSTAVTIDKITANRLVGYITYQCMAFDIFYVKDTIDLRRELNKLFDTNFADTKNFVDIKRDSKWAYYSNFMYPRNFSSEFLIDQDFLHDLVLQGDDLKGLRKVNHWIYVKNLEKRKVLEKKLERLNFSLDSIAYKKDFDLPYQLTISRQDSVDPISVFELTTLLRKISDSVNGYYDGWSTEPRPAE